jgi:hypothetical protein
MAILKTKLEELQSTNKIQVEQYKIEISEVITNTISKSFMILNNVRLSKRLKNLMREERKPKEIWPNYSLDIIN